MLASRGEIKGGGRRALNGISFIIYEIWFNAIIFVIQYIRIACCGLMLFPDE